MEMVLGIILIGSIIGCALSFILGILSLMFDWQDSLDDRLCFGFGIIFLILVFTTGLIGAILYGGKGNA